MRKACARRRRADTRCRAKDRTEGSITMNALTPAPLIRDVAFKDLRIPYLPETEVFGIDNVGWKVLIDSVFPAARSLDAIMMALAYCHKRKLDVFKKVVHIVPMWSTARNAMIETVWPGIAELRTTACR